MSETNGYVKWKIFIWTISIILGLFATCFAMVSSAVNKVEGYNNDIIEIKLGVQEIRTDQKWIMKRLDELNI